MKTTKVIIAMAVMILFFITRSIAAPEQNTSSINTRTQIKQIIHDVIEYPEFGKLTGLEGFVLVQYHIDELGQVQVDLINGSNKQLINYVKNKLGEINLPGVSDNVHYAKFVFKQL